MADKNAESTIKKWVATQSKEIMEKSKLLINLDEVEEKEASWLIPGYLPKGQICIMCGDGGAGKTTTWCALAASVSTGGKVFFDQTPDEFVKAEPQKVLFFSSEDSIEYVLRAKLRKSGANLKNIFSVSLKNPQFADVKFNSSLLKDIVAEVKPALAAYIQKRMEERQKRTEITQDRVLEELAAIAFARATDFAEVKDGFAIIKDTAGLSEQQIKAIAGIKEGKFGIELKLNDKEKALELLGRHLGMFKDRVEVSGLEEEKKKLGDILEQLRGGG